jgi:hypothetical protein
MRSQETYRKVVLEPAGAEALPTSTAAPAVTWPDRWPEASPAK